MRKISANLILTVTSAPMRNGIIALATDGRILEVADTGGRLKEEAGLEFHSGVIIPGLIIPWIRLGKRSVEELEKLLRSSGVRGAGLILDMSAAGDDLFSQLAGARTIYHPVLEICPGQASGKEPFDLLHEGIEKVSHAFNDYDLSCSLMSCSREKDAELENYIREYARSHENAIPSAEEVTWNEKTDLLRQHPRKGMADILPSLTIDAAAKICLEDEMGSIEAGKRPGLNLVRGLESEELIIGEKTVLKALA